jgi:hypothetical protein
MNDPHQELRDNLEQLHSEIQRSQPADETQRQHLESMQSDVRALLDTPGAVAPAHAQSVGQRLSESLEHFEITHPALSALIEQALNTLSNMGV